MKRMLLLSAVPALALAFASVTHAETKRSDTKKPSRPPSLVGVWRNVSASEQGNTMLSLIAFRANGQVVTSQQTQTRSTIQRSRSIEHLGITIEGEPLQINGRWSPAVESLGYYKLDLENGELQIAQNGAADQVAMVTWIHNNRVILKVGERNFIYDRVR